MRVAVFGAGSVGSRHIGNLLDLGCEVAIVEPDVERQRAALATFPAATIADGVDADAVVIATPYDQHLDIAHACVTKRIPFFVEKPIGAVGELDAWRQIAHDARHLTTQVGYQCRFHPSFLAMRRMAPATRGIFETLCDMRTWPGRGYGSLMLEASHDLDLALALGADATVTQAHVLGDDVSITLGDGFTVHLRDRSPDYLRCWRVERDGEYLGAWFCNPRPLVATTYYDEMAHFLDCVALNRQTDVPLSDGVRVLEVCSQVEQVVARAA